MKAALMRANDAHLEIEEVELDDPGPREVRLKLDEMVSSRIGLEQVNEAFGLIRKGETARQVIVFD